MRPASRLVSSRLPLSAPRTNPTTFSRERRYGGPRRNSVLSLSLSLFSTTHALCSGPRASSPFLSLLSSAFCLARPRPARARARAALIFRSRFPVLEGPPRKATTQNRTRFFSVPLEISTRKCPPEKKKERTSETPGGKGGNGSRLTVVVDALGRVVRDHGCEGEDEGARGTRNEHPRRGRGGCPQGRLQGETPRRHKKGKRYFNFLRPAATLTLTPVASFRSPKGPSVVRERCRKGGGRAPRRRRSDRGQEGRGRAVVGPRGARENKKGREGQGQEVRRRGEGPGPEGGGLGIQADGEGHETW